VKRINVGRACGEQEGITVEMSGHKHSEGQREVESDVLLCCLCEISGYVGVCHSHCGVAEEKPSGIRRFSLSVWLATVKKTKCLRLQSKRCQYDGTNILGNVGYCYLKDDVTTHET
jgi:hypothetical protein